MIVALIGDEYCFPKCSCLMWTLLEPVSGQDVMDAFVLMLQLPWVAETVPRGLSLTENIVEKLETVVSNETFKAALSKSHMAGVHQQV